MLLSTHSDYSPRHAACLQHREEAGEAAEALQEQHDEQQREARVCWPPFFSKKCPLPSTRHPAGSGIDPIIAGGRAAEADHRDPKGHVGSFGGGPVVVQQAPVWGLRAEEAAGFLAVGPWRYFVFFFVLRASGAVGVRCQVHLLDFPNIVIKGSELSLPFQARLEKDESQLLVSSCAVSWCLGV